MNVYGTLDKSYHLGRKTKKSLIYRLKRRSQEVIQSIEKYYSGNPKDIIDLGTADGLMLGIIKDAFPFAKCFGIEYSHELVESSVDSRITVLQGDVNCLPIPSDSFDVAIA
ncbi:MAG: class I SAM-dependent methyltransferase, partial [Candidatus Heimdallarchaeota archaeon]|nr:class I SAM-dependent methyltransferase [Candidatus Heimdallarchaeota archaeon]